MADTFEFFRPERRVVLSILLRRFLAAACLTAFLGMTSAKRGELSACQ